MASVSIPGIQALSAKTVGDPRVRIAVLDGPVDRTHPCFLGANLSAHVPSKSVPLENGRMSAHGTHVSSVLFGQPSSQVAGVAPGCSGLIIPIFSDEQNHPTPQVELAFAINQAVEEGADVINISGGEFSASGRSDPMLMQAIRNCAERGVLVVAAAGNDACRCLHVPAALPSVLAVGAMDEQGMPLAMTNWGDAYRSQGILAPGKDIPGAVPGGGVALRTGTSFATPIVSGVVGLLLSLQLLRGESPRPFAVRDALLRSATRCRAEAYGDCRRFLVGTLNIPSAYDLLFAGETDMSNEDPVSATLETNGPDQVVPSDSGVAAAEGASIQPDAADLPTGGNTQATPIQSDPRLRASVRSKPVRASLGTAPGGSSAPMNSSVLASEGCGCGGSRGSRQMVYALGVVGYDFGTEARRDSFKQLMPSVTPHDKEGLIPFVPGDPSGPSPTNPIFPPNPYDARQIVNYLAGYPAPKVPFPTEGGFPRLPFDGTYDPPTSQHGDAFPPPLGPAPKGYPGSPAVLSEASRLIWTLNIELTPVYAIRPAGSFAEEAYLALVQALAGQTRDRKDNHYVSRVSIPGILTGETMRLFSGQVVPVLEPQVQGMYAWNETKLVNEAMKLALKGVDPLTTDPDERRKIRKFRRFMETYLNKLYYELRNMGQTSAERALNYAATNAFQFSTIAEDEASRKDDDDKPAERQLDTIIVERSAFCRMDSDCWDVKIRFFDPVDVRKARSVYRYTIDVSDLHPVSVGDVRQWEEAI